jgi:hypothetical protein
LYWNTADQQGPRDSAYVERETSRRKEACGNKVVAAFTFILTSGLMLKELAVLRKQESGIQCLGEFKRQVNPARNELESDIFQLQNGLKQGLQEHLDALKVPE